MPRLRLLPFRFAIFSASHSSLACRAWPENSATTRSADQPGETTGMPPLQELLGQLILVLLRLRLPARPTGARTPSPRRSSATPPRRRPPRRTGTRPGPPDSATWSASAIRSLSLSFHPSPASVHDATAGWLRQRPISAMLVGVRRGDHSGEDARDSGCGDGCARNGMARGQRRDSPRRRRADRSGRRRGGVPRRATAKSTWSSSPHSHGATALQHAAHTTIGSSHGRRGSPFRTLSCIRNSS